METWMLRLVCIISVCGWARGSEVTLEPPSGASRFDPAEFVVRVTSPPFANPFTDAVLEGEFRPSGGKAVTVAGFADSEDGSTFRLRFCPDVGDASLSYVLRFRGGGIDRSFHGDLRVEPSLRDGPVIVDPDHPKHFRFAGSGRPFYHLGYTAYHLLDPSNDEATVDSTIDYCAAHGFNKIRFLLTGYPRDLDQRTSSDEEHGVPDPKRRTNYGAKPGQVNPLPAWPGPPHRHDFSRFNVEHWRRVDRAVRRLREKGIVATCIFTIEKQDLPRELGRLTEDEIRLYRYGVARLAAFDNVWWDLANEHNETRDVAWGEAMGKILREADPYDRLASAHGYADFLYPSSPWAGFIITQQYGSEQEVHAWALRYWEVSKPYVNEEYGYEGDGDEPGHGQNAGITRRCHWAVAMAGGYATYGDWSGGVSYFYMGEPGPGKAALELRHLRSFFESLPFSDLKPRDELTGTGFCLASPPGHHVFYLPRGGKAEIRLEGGEGVRFQATWYDPRAGTRAEGPVLQAGASSVTAPSNEDWVLHVREAAAK